MVMSPSDVSALKETLTTQQQLLQKLYNELEAEREASASATSEALSVILRLQSERAAIKMEAEQYKRLVEEKMCHADESLAVTEDIIYQKEMELAALTYQVQAYRYKLLSIGCADPCVGEMHQLECRRNETSPGSDTSIGRRNSAPVLGKYKNGVAEKDRATSPENLMYKIVETGEEVNDKALALDKMDYTASESITSYWEQIKKLDEHVKEIAGDNCTNFNREACSHSTLSSRISGGNLCDPNEVDDIDLSKHPAILFENSVATDYPFSPNIHDVFEVPGADKNCRLNESVDEDIKKAVCEDSESLEWEHLVHPKPLELYGTDEPDWLEKLQQSMHHCNSLCKPITIDAIYCHLAASQPSIGVSKIQPGLEQFQRTSEIVEVERSAEATNRDEGMKMLLNEIKEQVNSLRDEIRHRKVETSSSRKEPSLLLLSEAMLSFWL